MKRDYSISAIRFISMCFIVACHIMQYMDCELAWWFNVGVQIFLCVSGYLYGSKDIDVKKFYKNGFQKILVSYYVVIICFAVAGRYITHSVDRYAFLNCLRLMPSIKGGEHMWFIPTILFCYVITALLYSCFSKTSSDRGNFLKLILCLAAAYFLVPNFFSYYNPAWISCYIIGYYLATIKKRSTYVIVSTIIIITAAVMNTVQIINDYVRNLELNFNSYATFCNYAHALLGISLFIILHLVFKKIPKNFILKWSDSYSYEIYLVHQFFILGPMSLMKLTENTTLNVIIIILCTIASATIAKILSKMAHKVIDKISGKVFA